MILPDANLLLYAYDQSSLFHPKAAAWWENIMSRPSPVILLPANSRNTTELPEESRDAFLEKLRGTIAEAFLEVVRDNRAPMSAEATVVRNYIDWIITLPWAEYTEDKLEIAEAERVPFEGGTLLHWSSPDQRVSKETACPS